MSSVCVRNGQCGLGQRVKGIAEDTVFFIVV